MLAAGVAVRTSLVAPSQDVLGTYFPSWMLCAIGGVCVTVVLRLLFVRTGVDRTLPAPVVVYLASAAACSLGGWLLWLG